MKPILLAMVLALGLSATLPAEDTSRREAQQTVAKDAPAVPQMLGQEERAKLQARAEEAGPEVKGGALSNEHLTYIVIALAAAVIVLILV